ncbi:MAG: nuclear transport factor 2 family protein [Caulobacteraceae bacterium]
MSEMNAKLTADDRLDIIELFAKYAWAIDLADPELAVSCFAEDGYFDHLWQGRVQGHEAIVKNLESLWYDRQSWWYGRQHLFSHFLITADSPDRAVVKSFFQIIQFNTDYNTNFVFGIGTRSDTVVKQDGKWLFKTLYVNAWTSRENVPWQGRIVMPARPSAPGVGGPPPAMPPELEPRRPATAAAE